MRQGSCVEDQKSVVMRIKAVCDQHRESAYEQGEGRAQGAVCPLSQWTPCLASPDMTLPSFCSPPPRPRHLGHQGNQP